MRDEWDNCRSRWDGESQEERAKKKVAGLKAK